MILSRTKISVPAGARTFGQARAAAAPSRVPTVKPLVVVRGSPYSTPITNGTEEVADLEARQTKLNSQITTAAPVSAASLASAEDSLCQLLLQPELDVLLLKSNSSNGHSIPGSKQLANQVAAQAQLLDVTVAGAMRTAYGDAFTAKALHLLPTFYNNSTLGRLADALEAAKSNGSAERSASPSPQDQTDGLGVYDNLSGSDAAHLFLQRVLYRINRLNLFWFDDMSNYTNDRSVHLARIRDAIEAAWQAWEADQLGEETINKIKAMSPAEAQTALRERYTQDVEPPLSNVGQYISDSMGVEGYRELLAVASLDGLVEASRQSRVCGGAANDIACMVFRVLMEEYGSGRLAKKHSTFFASMMRELNLNDEPETYLNHVPWQCLAGANQNFLLTERRRHYLRYLGGLTYFEVVGPSVYRTYLAAAKRLGLSEDASGYWALHIKEDERHGKWMVEDVAVPLADRYPGEAWELVLGYDQEKSMAKRAANVVLAQIRAADERGFKGLTTKKVERVTAGVTA